MDISYYKKYEPVDGKWYFNKELGSGAFGKVFEIERRDFTNDKSALKIITIPSSPSEVSSYREENYDLDEKSITSYFYGFVEEFIKEFQLMTKLKGNSNIVSIEDYDVKQHDDEIGWDILIRMELLTPMNKFFAQNSPKIRDVIKLGIDICKALEVCQKFNIVHRDIKPSNIFVSETGEYKLGDFGVARTLEKTSSGLSKKGTYTYMAPEVYKGEAYSSNVDIYSLGIVMYKLLNNNMEPYKQGRTHEDEENALIARLKGEPMSKPANADGRLAEIILKACAFEPKDRYESPLQMRNELESILYSENEEKIIYPEGENLEYEPSKGSINEEPATSGIFDTVSQNDVPEEDEFTKGIFDVVEDKNIDEHKTELIKEQEDNEKNSEMKRELSWKGILAICSVLLIVIIAVIWGTTANEKVKTYQNYYSSVDGRVEFIDNSGYILINNSDIVTFREGLNEFGNYYLGFEFSEQAIEKINEYVVEKPGQVFDVNINDTTISKLTIDGAVSHLDIGSFSSHMADGECGYTGAYERDEYETFVNLLHSEPRLKLGTINGYEYIDGTMNMPNWYVIEEVAVKGNQLCFCRENSVIWENNEGSINVTVFTADADGFIIDMREYLIFNKEALAKYHCEELNQYDSDGTNSFGMAPGLAKYYYCDNVLIEVFMEDYYSNVESYHTLNDVIDMYAGYGWNINYLD